MRPFLRADQYCGLLTSASPLRKWWDLRRRRGSGGRNQQASSQWWQIPGKAGWISNSIARPAKARTMTT